MVAHSIESVQHFDIKDRATYGNLGLQTIALVEALGGFSPSTTGELSHPEHYEGPLTFKDLVDFGKSIDALRNVEVPKDQRWTPENQHLVPKEVKILSHIRPSVQDAMSGVSELVGEMSGLQDTPASRRKFEDQLNMYADLIDLVMDQVADSFVTAKKGHVVTVTLLRGGARFEETFSRPYPDGHVVSVEAKRLDKADKRMEVGFAEWKGLEAVQQFPGEVELEFADDCLASAVTIRAALLVLHEKMKKGEFPKISKVRCHASVGQQTGVEELLKFVKALDKELEIEVVIGDVAFKLSPNCYILRTSDERDTRELPFSEGAQYVGDMGFFLTQAEKLKKESPPQVLR